MPLSSPAAQLRHGVAGTGVPSERAERDDGGPDGVRHLGRRAQDPALPPGFADELGAERRVGEHAAEVLPAVPRGRLRGLDRHAAARMRGGTASPTWPTTTPASSASTWAAGWTCSLGKSFGRHGRPVPRRPPSVCGWTPGDGGIRVRRVDEWTKGVDRRLAAAVNDVTGRVRVLPSPSTSCRPRASNDFAASAGPSWPSPCSPRPTTRPRTSSWRWRPRWPATRDRSCPGSRRHGPRRRRSGPDLHTGHRRGDCRPHRWLPRGVDLRQGARGHVHERQGRR